MLTFMKGVIVELMTWKLLIGERHVVVHVSLTTVSRVRFRPCAVI